MASVSYMKHGALKMMFIFQNAKLQFKSILSLALLALSLVDVDCAEEAAVS